MLAAVVGPVPRPVEARVCDGEPLSTGRSRSGLEVPSGAGRLTPTPTFGARMQPPRWDDPIGSACREAETAILRGLPVRPTLYGFVDDEPVIRVQPGLAALGGGDLTLAMQHLAVVPVVLGLEQALVFGHARTTDPQITDEHLRDALARYAIDVEVGRRESDGTVTVDAHLVEREVEGGEVRWSPPTAMEVGGWTELLRYALAGSERDDGPTLSPGCLAYGLSRSGAVVEVAPGWRERLGSDRLEHREVRTVDRRRARHLARRGAGSGNRGGLREVRT
jgi:hypothetical protein